MNTLADLRPGDIGFGPIKGGAGMLVNAGQLLLGEGFRVGRLDIRHVFVVTEAVPAKAPQPGFPDGRGARFSLVEAMPRGARFVHAGADRWTPEYAYVRIAEDYPGQAADAAAIARAMIGTPYSFASYAALAAWRFGLKAEHLERWIDRRREDLLDVPGYHGPARELERFGLEVHLPREAICSVLADQAWSLAGKRIMHGVARQCVTPGALARRLMEMASEGDQATWRIYPGRQSWQR